MNKLERKLIELGYETDCEIYQIWHKGNIQIITFYGKTKQDLLQKYYDNIKNRYDNYYDSVYYNKAVLKFNELLNKKEIEE